MTKQRKKSTRVLDACGVRDPLHQRILLENLPCGETDPQAVLSDATMIQINAPRALMIVQWKGMMLGFRLVEARRREEHDKV
jgi:hypothetical protein